MLPLDAVTTIGRRLDPAALEPPPNVAVVQYVPQEQLLADCDAMVTHGGSGSLLGAFAFGLPVVLVELPDEKLEHGRLAGTVGAYNADARIQLNVQVDVLEKGFIRCIAK